MKGTFDCEGWGSLVDLFTILVNKKFPVYISLFPDDMAREGDAFQLHHFEVSWFSSVEPDLLNS